MRKNANDMLSKSVMQQMLSRWCFTFDCHTKKSGLQRWLYLFLLPIIEVPPGAKKWPMIAVLRRNMIHRHEVDVNSEQLRRLRGKPKEKGRKYTAPEKISSFLEDDFSPKFRMNMGFFDGRSGKAFVWGT